MQYLSFIQCRLPLITIAGSMWLSGCATPMPTIAESKFASPVVVEPFVPNGDSISPNKERVSLEELLIFADKNSPAVRTARARLGFEAAEYSEAQLVFPGNPVVSVGAGGRSIDRRTGFEFEVAIEQQLEIAGERGLRIDLANSQGKVAESIVNEVRWSVHVEVHRLFVDILVLRERQNQAERFVAFAKSLRDVAKSQVEAGESSPLTLLVADADLAQTREDVIQTKQALKAFEARLVAVVGWPRDSLPTIEGTLPEVKPPPSIEILTNLMATHHPSLRTRELAVLASKDKLALENREAWPEPTIGFSYGREAASGSEVSPNIWMFHLSVPVSIWRTNQKGKALAKSAIVVANAERDANATNLRSRLVEVSAALSAAAKRVELYSEDVVPQLERNLSLLQRAYELGEVDVHQVSQTRERLLTATGKYLAARMTYYETAAELEGLVGTEIWSETEEGQ